MNSKTDDIVRLALDFYTSPARYPELMDPSKPLPINTGDLLELAAGVSEPGTGADASVPADTSYGELIAAVDYFIQQVLMVPGGSHYRVLGLNPGASEEQIRKHYRLLNQLLFLDRRDKSSQWNTGYALRINHAYSLLHNVRQQSEPDPRMRSGFPGVRAVADQPVNEQARGDKARAGKPSTMAPVYQAREGTRQVGEENRLGAGEVADKSKLKITELPSERGRPFTPHPVNEHSGGLASNSSFVASNIDRAYGEQSQRVVAATNSHAHPPEGDGLAVPPLLDDYLEGGIQDQPLVYSAPRFKENVHDAPTRRAFPLVQATVILLVIFAMGLVIYALQTEPTGLATHSKITALNRVVPTEDGNASLESGRESSTVDSPVIQESPAIHQSGGELTPLAPAPEQQSLRSNRDRSTIRQQEQEQANGIRADTPAVVHESIPSVQTESAMPLVSAPAQREERPGEPSHVVTQEAKGETGKGLQPVTAADASATPFKTPESQGISDVELNGLIAKFLLAYEAGDINLFVSLFAENAHSDDQNNREGIKRDYQELFAVTDKRVFTLKDIRWAVEGARAKGEGDFSVDVHARNAKKVKRSAGKITLQVEKGPRGLVITEIKHVYVGLGANSNRTEKPGITEAELNALVDKFVLAYQRGDINLLVSLFAENAHSDDQNSREGIKRDYQELFALTDKRSFAFKDVRWKVENGRAKGEGGFNVDVHAKNTKKARRSVGKVSIHVEKSTQGLVITELKHVYDQASAKASPRG